MKKWLLAIITLSSAFYAAEPPHAGYIYPAGGKQGSVIEVVVGGKYIKDASRVTVNGSGVFAVILPDPDAEPAPATIAAASPVTAEQKPIAPLSLTTPEQRPLLQARAVTREQAAPLPAASVTGEINASTMTAAFAPAAMVTGDRPSAPSAQVTAEEPAKPVMSVTEEKKPLSPALPVTKEAAAKPLPLPVTQVKPVSKPAKPKARKNDLFPDTLILRIAIFDDAEPGNREVRVLTPGGISNKLTFQVGTLKEVLESEPNDRKDTANELKSLPAVLNGTIIPGDIDVYKFSAVKGSRLVFKADIRALKPFMADAVPGWFQGSMALYDSNWKELTHTDNFYTGQDPVLIYDTAADGDYYVELRDSIFRGREDFVYRLSLGELPFISGVFPLGAKYGVPSKVRLYGENLGENTIEVFSGRRDLPVQNIRGRSKDGAASNSLPFAFSDLPELINEGGNETIAAAKPVLLPCVINGRILTPGIPDVYSFEAAEGEVVSLDAGARRFGSPMDTYLEVLDKDGLKLAENDDDATYKWLGTITHHSDSFISFKAPKAGTYFARIRDIQGKGGQAFGYRLRLSRPLPDFEVYALPAGVVVPKGGSGWISLRAVRKEGFKGDIRVFPSAESQDIRLSSSVIPDGKNEIKASFSCSGSAEGSTRPLELMAGSTNGNAIVIHHVTAAEELMQAFAWKHIVPVNSMQIAVGKEMPFTLYFDAAPEAGIDLTQGKEVKFVINVGRRGDFAEPITLALITPPEGVSLRGSSIGGKKDSFEAAFRADFKAKPGQETLLLQGSAAVPVEERQVAEKGRREKLYVYAPVLKINILKGKEPPAKKPEQPKANIPLLPAGVVTPEQKAAPSAEVTPEKKNQAPSFEVTQEKKPARSGAEVTAEKTPLVREPNAKGDTIDNSKK